MLNVNGACADVIGSKRLVINDGDQSQTLYRLQKARRSSQDERNETTVARSSFPANQVSWHLRYRAGGHAACQVQHASHPSYNIPAASTLQSHTYRTTYIVVSVSNSVYILERAQGILRLIVRMILMIPYKLYFLACFLSGEKGFAKSGPASTNRHLKVSISGGPQMTLTHPASVG